MRFCILALSLLGFLVIADDAKAGLSATVRDLSASVDPVSLTDGQTEATRETEHQIGLDKAKRRDVQRQLAGLGFDTKLNGRFDESTRAAITRWQAARGYPQTGFLNALQHEALLTETVSSASSSSSDKSDDGHSAAHHHRNSGGRGPGGLMGGLIGGMFGRR